MTDKKRCIMGRKIIIVLLIALFKNVCCTNLYSRDTVYQRDCKEIFDKDNTVSGIYTIQPNLKSKPFMVLCDMETNGGGWTHLHKRFDGSLNFDRTWNDYKYGFGNLDSEFWLGLENMYELTGNVLNELLVELVDSKNKTAYARYEHFSIGSEFTQYSLKVLGRYNGTAGDSLKLHQGMKFTTKDKKNDYHMKNNCASIYVGGWWYHKCFESNLNGHRYVVGPQKQKDYAQGIIWKDFRGFTNGLKSARMLVRPLQV